MTHGQFTGLDHTRRLHLLHVRSALKGVTEFFIVGRDRWSAVLSDLTCAFKCPCVYPFVSDCVFILQKITPGNAGICSKTAHLWAKIHLKGKRTT